MDRLVELDKKDLTNVFNSELATFLKVLNGIFKKEVGCEVSASKIKAYKTKLNGAIMINARIAIEAFSVYILSEENKNFTEEIRTRNYDHFIHLSNTIDNDNQFRDLIEIIVETFVKLTDGEKEDIFVYLQNLCMVSNVYATK
jgi:hypothetical protein